MYVTASKILHESVPSLESRRASATPIHRHRNRASVSQSVDRSIDRSIASSSSRTHEEGTRRMNKDLSRPSRARAPSRPAPSHRAHECVDDDERDETSYTARVRRESSRAPRIATSIGVKTTSIDDDAVRHLMSHERNAPTRESRASAAD